MENRNVLVRTSKLCKTFSSAGVQQHVLKNLDLSIYQGDFTVIMGASGSGKSTLLYALSGMDKPTLGKIEFCREEISGYTGDQLAVFRRKNCGFVFQQVFLMENMSVMDNALSTGLLVNSNKKALRRKADDLFERVNIPLEARGKFPAQLSGGEAQRCGIVRALMNDPKLIFADEPTGALNSANGKAVLDVLTQVNANGQSVVMVTHDIRSARRGNRVVYLRDGVICGVCALGKYVSGDKERHAKLRDFLAEMGW